jgi:hypothetical protein
MEEKEKERTFPPADIIDIYSITLVHGSQQILFDVKVKSCCPIIPGYYLFKV